MGIVGTGYGGTLMGARERGEVNDGLDDDRGLF